MALFATKYLAAGALLVVSSVVGNDIVGAGHLS